MKSIFLIALSSITLSVSAQEISKDHITKKDKKDKMERYMPMMTRGIGVSLQKFSGLKDRLAGFPQYKSLRNHMFTISAGSMHVVKNFVSQLTLSGGSSLSGDRDKQSSALRYLGAGLDFGYDVIPADRVMVYPMVGIGAETYHAIFYKDVSGIDFDDVAGSPTVQNSIRSVKFVNTFIAYRLGLGIAFKAPKGNGTIGVQAHYIGGFKEKGWKSAENQSLNDAPSDDLHRVSISLVFSGGRMMR